MRILNKNLTDCVLSILESDHCLGVTLRNEDGSLLVIGHSENGHGHFDARHTSFDYVETEYADVPPFSWTGEVGLVDIIDSFINDSTGIVLVFD